MDKRPEDWTYSKSSKRLASTALTILGDPDELQSATVPRDPALQPPVGPATNADDANEPPTDQGPAPVAP